MSENVISTGVMVPLTKPISNYQTASWDGYSEWLAEIGLYINYEGTIIFSEETQSEDTCNILFSNKKLYNSVVSLCEENGIDIIKEEAQFYVSYWYNGADSHQSDITLEEYRTYLGD